jgi:hypothetical protein
VEIYKVSHRQGFEVVEELFNQSSQEIGSPAKQRSDR